MTTTKSFRAKIVGGNIEFQVPAQWLSYATELTDLEARMLDIRPVFEKFGGYHLESIARTHAQQGRPKKWRELAESTKADRKRKGFPPERPILERTGTMKNAYAYKYTKTTYWMDNPTPYFKYHQKGTKRIPQRIVIQLLAQDKAQFTRYRNQYLRGEFGFL